MIAKIEITIAPVALRFKILMRKKFTFKKVVNIRRITIDKVSPCFYDPIA